MTAGSVCGEINSNVHLLRVSLEHLKQMLNMGVKGRHETMLLGPYYMPGMLYASINEHHFIKDKRV